MTTLESILNLHDSGEPVEAIAEAVGVSAGYVYSVLRDHRPKRRRKPHRTWSDKPDLIAGLFKQGHKPARIAAVLGVSRQYVYRHLAGHTNGARE